MSLEFLQAVQPILDSCGIAPEHRAIAAEAMYALLQLPPDARARLAYTAHRVAIGQVLAADFAALREAL